MPASQLFATAYKLTGAPTNGGSFTLENGSGSRAPKTSVTITDTSGRDNINTLGDVASDGVTVSGLNNGGTTYWGTAVVNGVQGIVVADPNGPGTFVYYFLSNASASAFANGTASTASATLQSTTSGGTASNTWTLAGDTTPTAPAITSITDDVAPTTGTVAAGTATDDPTPTINGTAGAGLTISVYDNGTLLGTTTSAANGTWSYTPTTARTDGSHSFTATATNPALTTGATSGSSGAYAVRVDTTASTVSGVAYGSNDGALAAGEPVTLLVTFTENVFVAGGNPTLGLSNGATATYTGGTGTNTLTFTYTPAAGHSASDLAVTGFALPTGVTVRDAAGNNVNAAGAAANPAGTLAVDAAAPSITAAAAPSGTFGIGQEVSFALTGSEALTVTGTPTLTLSNGATATYASGSGTGSLVFRYTVAAGQTDSGDVNVTAVNGTIKDAAGNSLQSFAVGTAGTTAVDASAPTATTTVALAHDTATPGDGISAIPALTGVATGHQPGDTITIRDNDVVVGTAAIGANGAWTFANAGATGGGHGYTAAVTDAAGNSGTATATSPASTSVNNGGNDDLTPLATSGADLVVGGDGSDTVVGGGGDDTLWGDDTAGNASGDGNDRITAGAGNDSLLGGGGNDTLAGGAGNDTLDGGAGSDTANYQGATAAVSLTYDSVAGAFAGADGSGGTDTLRDVESILTGLGNDSLDASGSTRSMFANGGSGADTLTGGTGNDAFQGDDGNDSLAGAGGDDTLTGGAGNDALAGGDGGDLLSGGAGDDNLSGGGGNDTIVVGGSGSDTIDGGAGSDTVVFAGNKAGYTVTSVTNDGPQYFLVKDTDATNGDEGTTKVYGAENLSFADQADPVCFYPGTLVATPSGERPVEALAAGDLVLTAEGEAKPIRWLGRQTVSTRFGDPLRVLPVRIAAGALGENLPARDLLVSPDHALLVGGALVQAGALVNGTTVRRERGVPEVFTYWHVELADHALVLAEGVPAETFIDNVARLAFDNWAEHGAAADPAPMAEMALPRAKAARQVPQATRRLLAGRAALLLGKQTAAA